MNHALVPHPVTATSSLPLFAEQHPIALHATRKHASRGDGTGARRRTRGLLRSLLSVGAALLAASCAGNGSEMSTSSSAGGGGSVASSTGTSTSTSTGTGTSSNVTLSAGAVATPSTVGGYIGPGAGDYFFSVQVTLDNVSAPSAIPAGFAYFSLATTMGLVLMPSKDSPDVSMPCSAGTSVTTGAKYTCTLLFNVPNDDLPKQLSYDDMKGDTATAPASIASPQTPVSASCSTFAVYANEGSLACLTCTSTKCGNERASFDNQKLDGKTCPSAPTDCASCPPNDSVAYCACNGACLGACEPSFDAMYTCFVANCSSACM